MKNMKKNIRKKMDVFECHFLADRPRSLAFQVSLVYEYFVFSPTKPHFGGFRCFSQFCSQCIANSKHPYHPYIESTIILSDVPCAICQCLTTFHHICSSSLFYVQRHDDIYRDFFHHVVDLRHAIYTHRYNPSGTKLFVAGGPLPLGLYGSYAAFWQ